MRKILSRLKRMNIGIIGSGEVAEFHIKLIQQIPSLNLIGFHCNSEQNQENLFFSEKYNIKQFDNKHKLISEVDVLDLICPINKQFICVQDSIRAGKDIFIGNPLGITEEESNKLIKLAKEAEVVSYISNKQRFNSAFLAIKEEIYKPLFVNIEHSTLFNKLTEKTSVILDLMLEDLDVVFDIIKSPIKSINANGATFSNSTIDIANVRIEFLNGSTANLSANHISYKETHQIELVQNSKLINVDYLNKSSQILAENKDTDKLKASPFIKTEPSFQKKNASLSEFEHFLYLLKQKTSNTNALEKSRLSLKVAKQIINIINNKL